MRATAAILNSILGVIVVATAAATLIRPESPPAALLANRYIPHALGLGYLLMAAWTAYARRVPWAAIQWIAALVGVGVFGELGAILSGRQAVAIPPMALAVLVLLDAAAFGLAEWTRRERNRDQAAP